MPALWNLNSPFSTTANDGQRRWRIFCEENCVGNKVGNTPIFVVSKSTGELTPIPSTKNEIERGWIEFRNTHLGSSGKNIWVFPLYDENKTPIDASKVLRYEIRVPGTIAAKMEKFVAVAAVLGIEDVNDIIEVSEDGKKVNETIAAAAAAIKGVTTKELRDMWAIVMDDPGYANSFGLVAKNLRRACGNLENYSLLSTSDWNAIKKHSVDVLNGGKDKIHFKHNLSGDKWNPADLCFTTIKDLKDQMLSLKDITELNEFFNDGVAKKTIFPISVKKDSSAIKGAAGITSYMLSTDYDANAAYDCIKKGEVRGVRILYNRNKKEDSEDFIFTDRQLRGIDWVRRNKDQVAKVAMLAAGLFNLSSNFYIVNDKDCEIPNKSKGENPQISHVVINLSGDACWVKVDKIDEYFVIRSKGSTQMSTEQKKLTAYAPTQDWIDAAIARTQEKKPRNLLVESLEESISDEDLLQYLKNPQNAPTPEIGDFVAVLGSLMDEGQKVEILENQNKPALLEFLMESKVKPALELLESKNKFKIVFEKQNVDLVVGDFDLVESRSKIVTPAILESTPNVTLFESTEYSDLAEHVYQNVCEFVQLLKNRGYRKITSDDIFENCGLIEDHQTFDFLMWFAALRDFDLCDLKREDIAQTKDRVVFRPIPR